MKFLLDTNIWIDLAARPQSYPESIRLFKALEESSHKTCLCLCSYTTIYYLIARILKPSAALEFLTKLELRSVQLLPFSHNELATARRLQFADHEDACVAATALNSDCDYIVTRNIRDFRQSPIKALSPTKALEVI